MLPRGSNITADVLRAWDIIPRMFKSMLMIHPGGALVKSAIENELKNMRVGDVVPIYVACQNAGIIFRKRSTTELTFECFEVAIPNEVITNTIGKIVVQYPANARLVVQNSDELLSALANAISFLASQHIEEVFPGAEKKDAEHEDVWDTPSPRYITEFLAGYIRAVGPTSESAASDRETVFIQKRIDDRVITSGTRKQPWRRSPMWLLIRVALQTTLEDLKVAGGEGYKAFQAFFMAHLLQRCFEFKLEVVPDDIIHWMNRKLARRMWKL
ncbi:hypothetical protein M408DRAFT_75557, partial [Serendipita vermifera MAFF 305830]